MIRRTAAVAALAVALAVPVTVAPAPPAEAARTCATKADFRKVHKGQTQKRVRKILHQRGRVVAYRVTLDMHGNATLYTIRTYRACRDRYAVLNVGFRESRAVLKIAVW